MRTLMRMDLVDDACTNDRRLCYARVYVDHESVLLSLVRADSAAHVDGIVLYNCDVVEQRYNDVLVVDEDTTTTAVHTSTVDTVEDLKPQVNGAPHYVITPVDPASLPAVPTAVGDAKDPEIWM
jgi:hypothetical protein